MERKIIYLLFAFLLLSTVVDAQTEGVSTTASKGKGFIEVHKGPYVATDIGYNLALFSDIYGLSSGFMNSISVGYDILDILSVEAGFGSFFISADNSTGYAYGYGYNSNGELVYFDAAKCKSEFEGATIDVGKCADLFPKYLSNDISVKLFFMSAKFAFLSTERIFAYVRGGGGFALLSPDRNYKSDGSELKMNSSSLAFDGGCGVEYYTNLRHFSVALEARAYYFMGIGTLILNLQPSLKYTF